MSSANRTLDRRTMDVLQGELKIALGDLPEGLIGAWAKRASQAPLRKCLNNALRLGKVVLQMLHCVFGVAASEAVPFAAAAGLHIL